MDIPHAGDRNLARMVLGGFVPPTEPSGANRILPV